MSRLLIILTVLALVAVAYAGWSAGGGGGGGGHSPHGGWGGKKYQGWANVKAWQGPWSSQYSLDEHGNGYNRYAWVQQESSKGHGKGW